jgi:hypothetical protein
MSNRFEIHSIKIIEWALDCIRCTWKRTYNQLFMFISFSLSNADVSRSFVCLLVDYFSILFFFTLLVNWIWFRRCRFDIHETYESLDEKTIRNIINETKQSCIGFFIVRLFDRNDTTSTIVYWWINDAYWYGTCQHIRRVRTSFCCHTSLCQIRAYIYCELVNDVHDTTLETDIENLFKRLERRNMFKISNDETWHNRWIVIEQARIHKGQKKTRYMQRERERERKHLEPMFLFLMMKTSWIDV